MSIELNTNMVSAPVSGVAKNLVHCSHGELGEGLKSLPSFFSAPPQQLAFDCVRDNTTRELRLLCALKTLADRRGRVALNGLIARLQVITGDKQSRTVTARINRLRAWGWITMGANSCWPLSWEKIKLLCDIKPRKRTRLDVTKDFLTQIFTEAIEPMYAYQDFLFTRVKAKPRKGQKIRATLQQKHRGGIALSLIAAFFKRSKAWAFKLKAKCKGLDLLDFEHRFLMHENLSPIDALAGIFGPAYFVIGNTVFERLSDVITVCEKGNYN